MHRLKIFLSNLILILTSWQTLNSQTQLDSLKAGQKKLNDILKILTNQYLYNINMGIRIDNLLKDACEGLDPFTKYLSPEDGRIEAKNLSKEFVGIGILTETCGDSTICLNIVPSTPAQQAGMKVGDRIIRINAIDTKGKSSKEISQLLRGQEREKVSLRIHNPKERNDKEVIVVRDKVENQTSWAAVIPGTHIGYLRIDYFGENTGKEATDEILRIQSAGTHELIIDLRNNRGGSVKAATYLVDSFLPKGKLILSQKAFRNGEEQIISSTYSSARQYFSENTPIVILTNKNTASASEILTLAMQEQLGAKIAGQKTYGKGIAQAVYAFHDDSRLHITICKNFSPNGHCIHKIGIEPTNSLPLKKIPLSVMQAITDKNRRWRIIQRVTNPEDTSAIDELLHTKEYLHKPLSKISRKTIIDAASSAHILMQVLFDHQQRVNILLQTDKEVRTAIKLLDSTSILPKALAIVPKDFPIVSYEFDKTFRKGSYTINVSAKIVKKKLIYCLKKRKEFVGECTIHSKRATSYVIFSNGSNDKQDPIEWHIYDLGNQTKISLINAYNPFKEVADNEPTKGIIFSLLSELEYII